MSNSTTNWLIKLNTDAELIDMTTSCISLVISIMIFIRVFDVAGLRKSIREKRIKMKREKERRDLELMKKLFKSYQNNEDVSNVSLSTDEEEEEQKKDEGRMRVARKKKNKAETSV